MRVCKHCKCYHLTKFFDNLQGLLRGFIGRQDRNQSFCGKVNALAFHLAELTLFIEKKRPFEGLLVAVDFCPFSQSGRITVV